MTDLLPCPFCGGEVEVIMLGNADAGEAIECSQCRTLVRCDPRTWNQRPGSRGIQNVEPKGTTVTEPLKPCPFCGKQAIIDDFENGPDDRTFYTVSCGSCNALMDADYWSEEEATSAWNNRI